MKVSRPASALEEQVNENKEEQHLNRQNSYQGSTNGVTTIITNSNSSSGSSFTSTVLISSVGSIILSSNKNEFTFNQNVTTNITTTTQDEKKHDKKGKSKYKKQALPSFDPKMDLSFGILKPCDVESSDDDVSTTPS